MTKIKWKIDGYKSAAPTGFSREVAATESQMMCVLKRLTARHLTDDEIVDATLGKSGTHFDINRDKRLEKPMQLSTTGTDYYYVATEVRDADGE